MIVSAIAKIRAGSFKLIMVVAILVPVGILAAESARFIRIVTLPTKQTVVIAEGESEARSLGSYSVRLYQPAAAEDQTTFFTDGLIRSRDGFIENVVLEDINLDAMPEIVVLIRSVGSGGYRSGYAFTFDTQNIVEVMSVSGLPADTDVLQALRSQVALK